MVHVMGALCNVRYWDGEWTELEELAVYNTTIDHGAFLLLKFQRDGNVFLVPGRAHLVVAAAKITVEMEVLRDKA